MRTLLCALAVLLSWTSPAYASSIVEVVAAGGGPPTRVARHQHDANGFRPPTWSSESAITVVGEEPAGKGPAVFRYATTGGSEAVLARLDGFDAVLAPTGATVADLVDTGLRYGRGGIVLRDIATGKVRAALAQSAEGDELYETPPEVCWSRDGGRVAIVAQEGRSATLRVVDVGSGRVLLRRRALGDVGAECFAPDGSRLVVTGVSRGRLDQSAAGVVDVATGSFHVLPAWGRPSPRAAAWSPDGDRLALDIDEQIAIVDPATGWGPALPVTDGPPLDGGSTISELRWSPAGDALAYLVQRDDDLLVTTHDALVTLPVRPAGPPRTLVRPRRADIAGLAWASDGTRIAYSAWLANPPSPRTVSCVEFRRDPEATAVVIAAIYGRLERMRALPADATPANIRSFIHSFAATWCANSDTPAVHKPYPAVADALGHASFDWP